jgi:outer membrane protein TolC
MKNNFLTLLIIVGLAAVAKGQESPLDEYIRIGLTSNQTLQQRQLQVEKAQLSLKEAKGLFLPNLTFQADYTLADGGRKIDLPIGDLLNPVYGTLNALTQSQSFPQIENVSEQFLPNNFHDTRLRMTMPVINTEIWYLQKIRKAGISENEAQLIVYRRDLVRDIKIAYYNFLKADQAEKIYTQALWLQEKNLALTQSLIKNDKLIPATALQIQAEISDTKAMIIEAQNNKLKAAAYLNFLINKPLDSSIAVDEKLTNTTASNVNKNTREEILQLNSGITQLKLNAELRKLSWAPTLGIFLDAGYQGFGYIFDTDQRYVLGGFQLKWNLFGGLQQQNKKRIAFNEVQNLELKSQEIERQLMLQLFTSEKNLSTSKAKYDANKESVSYNNEAYRVIQIRYRDGQAIPIELTQAMFQKTKSEIQESISLIDIKIAEAEVERAAASFQFNK